MFDNTNPGQPGGAEPPASTTEQLLRLLGQQPLAPSDEDAVNNPELEQLFGSLAKGLEQGTVDSALAPKGEPLTLEALAANLGQPVALGEVPAALAAREAGVACPKCGSANLAATRFCGMCGQGLVTEAPRASGNGAEPMVAASELPTLTNLGGRTGSSMGFKMALAGALVLALGLVAYQQRWWRLPHLTGVTSNVSAVRTSSSPKSRTAKPPAQALPAPAQPQVSVNREPATVRTPATEAAPAPAKQPEPVNREPAAIVRAPASVSRRPATVTKPPKAAPPVVIARNLPKP
ncbi:MAG: zinc ribbon domain-containing protein, partial [Terriglobales bacterium]